MGFFVGLGTVLKTVWGIFCEVTTTAVVDFMAFIPWPFKILPDSFLGLFMLLGLIALAIVVGFAGGHVANKVNKDPKKEWFWPGFGIGVVAVFVIYAVIVAIIG